MATTPTLQNLVAAYLAARGARSPYDLTRDPILSFPGIPNLAAGDVIVPPILPPQGPPASMIPGGPGGRA